MELSEYLLMASVEDKHWWWRARRDILSEVIRSYAGPNPRTGQRRVLEVGCGTGGNLPMMSIFGRLLGTEAEQTAVATLRSKYGDRFEVAQHAIPAPLPEKFDLIGMFDVLEHIANDGDALRWAVDQLCPGGVAVITVPAMPFLWTHHDMAAQHYRRYTRRSFQRLLPADGEVLHLTYFNFLLFPLVALIRLLLKVLPKGLRPKGTHMGLPPQPLNALLYRTFRQERRWASRMRMPWGVSLLAVIRRSPLDKGKASEESSAAFSAPTTSSANGSPPLTST